MIRRNFIYYFFSSFFVPAVSFISLPFLTVRLDAEDFGFYFLLQIYAVLISAIAALGTGYLWPSYWKKLDGQERKEFVSSYLLSGWLVYLVISILFWIGIPSLNKIAGFTLAKDKYMFYILCTGFLSFPWNHTIEYITITGRAKVFSLIICCGTMASAIVSVVCLFYFNLGRDSLFIGPLAQGFIYGFSSLFLLRENIKPMISFKWLKIIVKKGLPTTPGLWAEQCVAVFERNLINLNLSLSFLGIYAHAKKYKNLFATMVKSMAWAVWPVSLDEAHADDVIFEKTILSWRVMFLFFVFVSLAWAMLGREFISFLTHGKFSDAAIWVTFWIFYSSLQHNSKEAMATLYAENHGIFISYAQMFSYVLFIGMLMGFLRSMGFWAIMVSFTLQQVIYRLIIHYKALKIRKIKSDNTIRWVASGVIFLIMFIQFFLDNNVKLRILVFGPILLILSAACFVNRKRILACLASRQGVAAT